MTDIEFARDILTSEVRDRAPDHPQLAAQIEALDDDDPRLIEFAHAGAEVVDLLTADEFAATMRPFFGGRSTWGPGIMHRYMADPAGLIVLVARYVARGGQG